MKSNSTKELQQLVCRFQKEVMLNDKFEHLDILAVFIDMKEKIRRAIIIIQENCDQDAVEKLAKQYFKTRSYKVISREGRPKGTALLESGQGIRHSRGDGWGSLGGFFRRDNDEHILYGLSNNHVIANINDASAGDQIICENNVIAGELFNFIPLKPPPEINYVDAALFRLDPLHASKWNPASPKGIVGPRINLAVYKRGQTTGLTKGFVEAYNGFVKVMIGGRQMNFGNVIAIKGVSTSFNMPGDSGSIVLTKNHYMLGIVFAKFHDLCYALPISEIKPLLK